MPFLERLCPALMESVIQSNRKMLWRASATCMMAMGRWRLRAMVGHWGWRCERQHRYTCPARPHCGDGGDGEHLYGVWGDGAEQLVRRRARRRLCRIVRF